MRRRLTDPQLQATIGPEFRGNLDSPSTSVVRRDALLFRGWALAGSGAPAMVTVVINGTRRVRADSGSLRPDVPVYLGEPLATDTCGWMTLIDLRTEPPGDLRVQVEVADPGRVPEVILDRMFVLRGDGLTGSIDVPAHGSILSGNLLAIAGWVHAVDGVSRVDVYIDGDLVGPARLGLPRVGTHHQEPDRQEIAAGWELRCALDALAPVATHDITVSVTDRRGHSARLGSVTVELEGPHQWESDTTLARQLQDRTRGAVGRVGECPTDARRNILVFTDSLGIGGSQLYLQELLRGLIPSLESCRVIAAEGGSLEPELHGLGVDVSINPRTVPADVAGYEGAVRELAGYMRGSGYSSVLLNGIGQWFAADAAQRAGIPTVWALHESVHVADWLALECRGGAVPLYVLDRMNSAIQRASKIVFDSNATRAMFVSTGAPPEAAFTVPYGIDIDAIHTFAATRTRAVDRAAHDLPLDATVLVCIGEFEERKGQLWLVGAFAELLDVHPNAVLVLIGDHSTPYADAVRDLIAAKGIGGRVRTVPITSDAWPWYSMADVLISASDVESMPRSMLEAMAFGRPVLAASVFGIPELISDGDTGWLIPPRDTSALVTGMHRVLGLTEETRQEVGSAGRELVEELFRAEEYVRKYLEMIDEVEARPSGPG